MQIQLCAKVNVCDDHTGLVTRHTKQAAGAPGERFSCWTESRSGPPHPSWEAGAVFVSLAAARRYGHSSHGDTPCYAIFLAHVWRSWRQSCLCSHRPPRHTHCILLSLCCLCFCGENLAGALHSHIGSLKASPLPQLSNTMITSMSVDYPSIILFFSMDTHCVSLLCFICWRYCVTTNSFCVARLIATLAVANRHPASWLSFWEVLFL